MTAIGSQSADQTVNKYSESSDKAEDKPFPAPVESNVTTNDSTVKSELQNHMRGHENDVKYNPMNSQTNTDPKIEEKMNSFVSIPTNVSNMKVI